MPVGIEKLKARLEKVEAARKKAVRQSQLLSTKLDKQERRDDTRRKVIDGAHMQTEALTNPEIAALLHKRRDKNLTRDDDRTLFGLALLSDAEKAARNVAPARPGRGRSVKTTDGGVAALADVVAEIVSGAPASMAEERQQSEAA